MTAAQNGNKTETTERDTLKKAQQSGRAMVALLLLAVGVSAYVVGLAPSAHESALGRAARGRLEAFAGAWYLCENQI